MTTKPRKTRTAGPKPSTEAHPWFEDAVRNDSVLQNPEARLALADRVRFELAASAVVRLIVHRADAEKRQALDDLIRVDPSDVKAVADIKSRYARGNDIGRWIQNAIDDGKAVLAMLEEQGAGEIPED